MTDGPMPWQPRNTASSTQLKVTQSEGSSPNSTKRSQSLYLQQVMRLMDLTGHLMVGIERQPKLNTNLQHPTLEVEKQRLQYARTTCDGAWTIEPVIQDQFMDHEGVHQRKKTATKPGAINTTSHGPKTAYGLHLNCAVTSPDTEEPHTLYASPMK